MKILRQRNFANIKKAALITKDDINMVRQTGVILPDVQARYNLIKKYGIK